MSRKTRVNAPDYEDLLTRITPRLRLMHAALQPIAHGTSNYTDDADSVRQILYGAEEILSDVLVEVDDHEVRAISYHDAETRARRVSGDDGYQRRTHRSGGSSLVWRGANSGRLSGSMVSGRF